MTSVTRPTERARQLGMSPSLTLTATPGIPADQNRERAAGLRQLLQGSIVRPLASQPLPATGHAALAVFAPADNVLRADNVQLLVDDAQELTSAPLLQVTSMRWESVPSRFEMLIPGALISSFLPPSHPLAAVADT